MVIAQGAPSAWPTFLNTVMKPVRGSRYRRGGLVSRQSIAKLGPQPRVRGAGRTGPMPVVRMGKVYPAGRVRAVGQDIGTSLLAGLTGGLATHFRTQAQLEQARIDAELRELRGNGNGFAAGLMSAALPIGIIGLLAFLGYKLITAKKAG